MALVQVLTNLPRRQIVHELKAKGGIAGRVISQSNAKALIDEDPGSTQPKYFTGLTVAQDLQDKGLKLLHDQKRNNDVIVLCPRLEEWIVAAARSERVSLSTYGLPEEPRALHRVINLDLRKFERLVKDLVKINSARLRSLRSILNR
ncbi:MAG: hypothetical protein HYU29_05080 [Chloroflexi bacterium]|nr:hypothetical protein [Chloroflexota bacterium]